MLGQICGAEILFLRWVLLGELLMCSGCGTINSQLIFLHPRKRICVTLVHCSGLLGVRLLTDTVWHCIQTTRMALCYRRRCNWEFKQMNTVCTEMGSVTKAHVSYGDNVRIYEISLLLDRYFLEWCNDVIHFQSWGFFFYSNEGLQKNALFPGAELSQYFSITVNQSFNCFVNPIVKWDTRALAK